MAGALWTPAENKILKDMLDKGKSYKEIGEAIGRTKGSVERRVKRMKDSGETFAVVEEKQSKKAAAPTERHKKYKEKKQAVYRSKVQQRKAADPYLHKIVTQEPDVTQALQEVSEALETVFEAMKNHRLSKHQLQITLAAINLKEALERELENRSAR